MDLQHHKKLRLLDDLAKATVEQMALQDFRMEHFAIFCATITALLIANPELEHDSEQLKSRASSLASRILENNRSMPHGD